MRIGVDIRGLLTGKWSGVEQYTVRLLEEIIAIDSRNTYVLFYVSYRDLDDKFEALKSQHQWMSAPNVEVKTLRWINFPLLLHALWKPLLWPKVDIICGGLDIMWLPSPRLTPVTSKCRLIITFHDLIQEIFPQFYTWQSNLWHWQMSFPYLARRADSLIAVSLSTQADLVRLFGVDRKKIHVIYEGVEQKYFSPPSSDLNIRKKFNLTEDFIYYIGSLEPRKNVISVVRALASLKSESSGEFDKIKLVISGSKSWLSEPLFEEIEKLGLGQDVVITGAVTEAEKISFLHQARAFVFPSWYEGFGLPVLEAMAAGCPVITSSVASLPEVADDAAILIDPANQSEIDQALKELLTNPQLASRFVTAGKLQAKKFSWSKSARETLKLFENGGE